MRSVNVTYKIYEFSELSEDAKAKVKKWYLDNFYQNEEFSDICVWLSAKKLFSVKKEV